MEKKELKQGLFSIRKKADTDEFRHQIENNDNIAINLIKKEDNVTITMFQYGFEQSGRLGGTIPGLRVMLQKIYHDYRQSIKDDQKKQEELQKPYRVKIEGHESDISRIEEEIERKENNAIAKINERIKALKDAISDIKRNPQEVAGENAVKASFYVGLVILLFLTIYLFIFYSSASYSAFFKEFSLNEIGVANSIFDPKALSKAFIDGITELALILTIPFVFLGLGYLIHKFQEQKSASKYFKIAVLILITFVFDSILAYEITEKIYNIKRDNSFDSMPEYSMSFALKSINFWLIIFAGFVVYLIWGFVFDFVIDSASKLDKVKVAIEEKEKEIKDYEIKLEKAHEEIEKLSNDKSQALKEKNKLLKIISNPIIPRSFEQDIFSFSGGWMAHMKQSGKSDFELKEADKLTTEIVDKISTGYINTEEA